MLYNYTYMIMPKDIHMFCLVLSINQNEWNMNDLAKSSGF